MTGTISAANSLVGSTADVPLYFTRVACQDLLEASLASLRRRFGGLAGRSIHASLRWWQARRGSPIGQLLAAMWPWPTVVLFGWLFAQFVIGRFFNDWLMQSDWFIPLLILGLLVLSVLSANAYDGRVNGLLSAGVTAIET